MSTPFISYLRVSTQRQGTSGLGLDAQREGVQRFLQLAGSTLAAVNSSRSNRGARGPSSARSLSPLSPNAGTRVQRW